MYFSSFGRFVHVSSLVFPRHRSTSTPVFYGFLNLCMLSFTAGLHSLMYSPHPRKTLQCGKVLTDNDDISPSASHRYFKPYPCVLANAHSLTPIDLVQKACTERSQSGFLLHTALQCRSLSALVCQDAVTQAEHVCKPLTSNDQTQFHTCEGNASTWEEVEKRTSPNRRPNSVSNEKVVLRDTDVTSKQVKVVQESVEALEAVLKVLETSAPYRDPKIGALCLRLAQLCISKDEAPEKILLYGERAMEILGTPEMSLESATCLEVIGCAYYKESQFEKAVTYLERAAFILDKLKASVKEEEMGSLQYAVHALLGQAKMALGREEEALDNFQDALAVNESVLDAEDPELGKSYHQIAEVYMRVQDLHEALALCLKALPIYTESYGSSSLQVAELRKLLSIIYYGLDNFEKVLSEHQIIRPIFEALGKTEEVASLDLAAGEAFLCLDKYAKAISKLKIVVNQTTPVSRCHGQALVLLAKAYAYSEKVKSAKTYCKKALEVLRNKEPSVEAGASSVELALVFRQLDETDEALSTFKMALEVYQKFSNEQEAVAFIEGQIGLIYLGSGKTHEALPYLETWLAKNEGVLGLKNKELLNMYNQIGAVYVQLGKFDEALAKFEVARTVVEENNISKDPILITLYHNLASLYTTLGRLEDALPCQQLLVNLLKNTEIETEMRLEDAEKNLEALLQEMVKDHHSSRSQGKTNQKRPV